MDLDIVDKLLAGMALHISGGRLGGRIRIGVGTKNRQHDVLHRFRQFLRRDGHLRLGLDDLRLLGAIIIILIYGCLRRGALGLRGFLF